MKYKRVNIYNESLGHIHKFLTDMRSDDKIVYLVGSIYKYRKGVLCINDIKEVYAHTAYGDYKNPARLRLNLMDIQTTAFTVKELFPNMIIDRGFLICY